LANRHRHRAAVEGRDKPTEKPGSSSPLAALAPAAGGKDKHQPGGKRSQTPSFLETCLGEMIRIVVPVATVKAITKAPARAASTKGTTIRATITRDANVTIASYSRTRMAGSMERAKGRTTLAAPGAIQLVGGTLGVEICSLQKGFQTTPGHTEPAHITDSFQI